MTFECVTLQKLTLRFLSPRNSQQSRRCPRPLELNMSGCVDTQPYGKGGWLFFAAWDGLGPVCLVLFFSQARRGLQRDNSRALCTLSWAGLGRAKAGHHKTRSGLLPDTQGRWCLCSQPLPSSVFISVFWGLMALLHTQTRGLLGKSCPSPWLHPTPSRRPFLSKREQ